MTDQNGNVIQSYLYDEFGNLIPLGQDENELTYTGQEWEGPTTGLYYYGARYYDPTIGRFITPDSWTWGPDDECNFHSPNWKPSTNGEPAPKFLNRYVYCVDNPLNNWDPDGHFIPVVVAAVVLIVGWVACQVSIFLLNLRGRHEEADQLQIGPAEPSPQVPPPQPAPF